jgi:D-glycero-D-manno-heptose 1,7-bisphosphate phosphatase
MAAIFLDRDGVLNENRPDYVKSWTEFRWLPGALDALIELGRLGVPIIVVTNQSMVGRGLVPASGLEAIHRQMLLHLRQRGGRIDDILCCLHSPAEGCACRKPEPGLLRAAAQRHHIDLARSVLVGDAISDYEAATLAGTRYVHVRTGRGAQDASLISQRDPEVPITDGLPGAARVCERLLRGPSASAA